MRDPQSDTTHSSPFSSQAPADGGTARTAKPRDPEEDPGIVWIVTRFVAGAGGSTPGNRNVTIPMSIPDRRLSVYRF